MFRTNKNKHQNEFIVNEESHEKFINKENKSGVKILIYSHKFV